MTLVIATYGRSFWILDDITLLAADRAHRRAARSISRRRRFVSTTMFSSARRYRRKNPRPRIRPTAPSRLLPDAAGKDVTLDILDSNGKIVRHFSRERRSAASSSDGDRRALDTQADSCWKPPLGRTALCGIFAGASSGAMRDRRRRGLRRSPRPAWWCREVIS